MLILKDHAHVYFSMAEIWEQFLLSVRGGGDALLFHEWIILLPTPPPPPPS